MIFKNTEDIWESLSAILQSFSAKCFLRIEKSISKYFKIICTIQNKKAIRDKAYLFPFSNFQIIQINKCLSKLHSIPVILKKITFIQASFTPILSDKSLHMKLPHLLHLLVCVASLPNPPTLLFQTILQPVLQLRAEPVTLNNNDTQQELENQLH